MTFDRLRSVVPAVPAEPQPSSAPPESRDSGRLLRLATASLNRDAEGRLAGTADGAAREVPHRARMESAFGEDFSGVRAYTGRKAALDGMGARAAASGETIALASDSPSPGLVAHELTHVVQQRRSDAHVLQGKPARSHAQDAAEGEADRAAASVATGGRASVSQAPSAQVSLDAKNPFDDPASWKDAAGAAQALGDYKAMAEVDRRAAVATAYKKDLVKVLQSLAPDDRVNKYADQIREITRWVEEEETRASAKMTDDQIAAEQAKFLRKQAEDTAKAEALKKAPKAPVAPSAADIEVERKKAVEAVSIPVSVTTWWAGLSGADQASWTTRGNAAIAKVVAHAAAKHPELHLGAAHFLLAFEEVEKRGAGVVAMGNPAKVGKDFVTTAEVSPAYVMDVVVHEVFGHPEYGVYGREYHLALYDLAATKLPGYVKPAPGTPDRRSELDAYAYQETEIYAVLRSMPYRTAPAAADVGKVPALDTQGLVDWHVGLMKKQWAPSLIVAILRGLRMRLVIDPRITGPALAVFDKAVLKNFDAATLALVKA